MASAFRLSPHFPQGPSQQRTFLLSKGLNDSDIQVFRLILQKTVGRHEPVPTVALSFNDVASMAGVSRPTVIRSFKRLKAAKLIHTTRKTEDHYHAGQQVGLCPELLAPAIGVRSWRCDTNQTFTIHCGDALEVLTRMPDESVNCSVCSPPFFLLRDYDIVGQIGREGTPQQYISRLVEVFREVRRVLRNDGTLWINIGDTYATGSGGNVTKSKMQQNNQGTNLPSRRPQRSGDLKSKDLIGIPWMLAFALRADGWYLRSDIIVHKVNTFPESVADRPTTSHEHIFLLSKSPKYYYDADAIREPQRDNLNGHYLGRNRRTVWTVTTKPSSTGHYATFPPQIPETCLLAGSPEGGVVLDPFNGTGTTGIVALKHGRSYIGIELNPEYVDITTKRCKAEMKNLSKSRPKAAGRKARRAL